MYCNKCGAYMPDDAGFCPSCGARAQENVQQVPIHTAPVRGRNSVLIAAITAVAVVLVVCVVCFTIFMSRSPTDAQLKAQQDDSTAQQGVTQQMPQTDASATQQGQTSSSAETDAKDERDDTDNTSDSAAPMVTNNYYYYGSNAADDDEYYTRSESSGYLWPTDTQYISSADLSGLSKDTVQAIRNEIYARHGYAFTTTRWQEYFASKTWYDRDSTCTESTVNARLSSLERANIDTIVSYEESKGWR